MSWICAIITMILLVFCVGILVTAIIQECIINCKNYNEEIANWFIRGIITIVVLLGFLKCIYDTYRKCPCNIIIEKGKLCINYLRDCLFCKCLKRENIQIHVQNDPNLII